MSKKAEVKEEMKEEVKEKEARKEDLVYMGPSIPNVVRHSTVFKDGVFPSILAEKIREFPLIQSIFVPVGKMVDVVKELKVKNSAFSIVYRTIEEEIRKEKV